MGLGADVRRLRMVRGMSLEALAERAGLSANYVGSLEREPRDVSLRAVQRIAKALSVSVGELLGEGPDRLSPLALEAARQVDRLPPDVQDALVALLRTMAGERARTARARRKPARG